MKTLNLPARHRSRNWTPGRPSPPRSAGSETRETGRSFTSQNTWPAAIAIAAGELQQQFLWKTNQEIERNLKGGPKREAVVEEIADVLMFAILLADRLAIDVAEAIADKLAANERKLPRRPRLRQRSEIYGATRAVTEAWREDYNRVSPYGALGNRRPSELARPVDGHAHLPARDGYQHGGHQVGGGVTPCLAKNSLDTRFGQPQG